MDKRRTGQGTKVHAAQGSPIEHWPPPQSKFSSLVLSSPSGLAFAIALLIMPRDFPLSRRQFPDFTASADEHQACKEFGSQLLGHTVHEFERFAYDETGVVNPRRWKPKTTKGNVTMYHERVEGNVGMELAETLHRSAKKEPIFSPTAATLTPATMLLTGVRQGYVENAMNTLVTRNQEELALMTKFLRGDVADCAVLHTMEAPTPSKPFHFLGYKFVVMESLGDSRLIKRRHSVYLEYAGLTRTRTGEILGYHLMQSVALRQFPDLTDRNSVCALTSMRFLYRQQCDGLVEIFMLGNMDVSGSLIKPIAQRMVEDVVYGMTRVLECSEIKRLTQMAREFQWRKQAERRSRNRSRSRSRSRQDSVGNTFVCCTVCGRPSKGGFGGVKLVPCLICGRDVCPHCRATKQVFVSSNDGLLGKFVKVPACSSCTMEANISYYVQQQQSGSGDDQTAKRMRLPSREELDDSVSLLSGCSGRSGLRGGNESTSLRSWTRFFGSGKKQSVSTASDVSTPSRGRQSDRQQR
ncbi:hypothetical protein BBJ28_00004049 [Nothophytophthora sp. Chile5]|nr:hypothetical protein BBJ28_00004049 [Nothophytophthora sp. Chile5]